MAKRVRALNEKAEFLETYAVPMQRQAGENPEQLEGFVDEGVAFRDQLIEVIHGDLDARDINRRNLNAWLGYATKIERNTKTALYRAHKDTGGQT